MIKQQRRSLTVQSRPNSAASGWGNWRSAKREAALGPFSSLGTLEHSRTQPPPRVRSLCSDSHTCPGSQAPHPPIGDGFGAHLAPAPAHGIIHLRCQPTSSDLESPWKHIPGVSVKMSPDWFNWDGRPTLSMGGTSWSGEWAEHQHSPLCC